MTGRRSPMERFQRLAVKSSIPGSVPFILLAILSPAAVLSFRDWSRPSTATDAPVPAVPPSQIEARVQTEGCDRNNRRLPFSVYILSQDLSWRLESVSDFESGDALLSPELTDAINRANEVYCIGTASFEGATRSEEARAGERAETLGRWVRAVIRDPSKTRVISVNQGQYHGPDELQSNQQRKAILIATEDHESGVNLGEALLAGLQKQQSEHPIIYSLLHDYSRSSRWPKAETQPPRKRRPRPPMRR